MADDIKKVGIELTAKGAKEYKDSLKEITAATKENYSELKLAQSQYDKNTSSAKKLEDRQKYLAKQVEEYTKKEEILKRQLEGMESAENRDEAAIAKKKAEINDCQRKLGEYEKGLEDVTTKIKTHSAQLEDWGKKLQDVGGKMTSVGDALTKGITVPVAAAGAASVAAFQEVDKGMDTIVSKTGATGEAADAMFDTMNKLATTIPTDFETAGAAIGEVNTRFGVTGDSLEELSGQFIKFAALNNTDVSSSIDSTQKALAAYGKGAEDASGYLDVLNKVGQDTGVSTDKLTAGIVSNATAFKEMGLSLDEATFFMGTLEKSGANSETVLNGMRKALKNATAEGKPLNQALAELQDTIVNGTDSMDGLSAAYEIFGKSGDQIYGAVKDGTINFNDLAAAVESAGGSVSDTFDATVDPLDQFTTILNQMKILGTDIVTTAGPMLVELLQKLSDGAAWLSEKWNSLDDDQKEMILKMVGLAAAVGPVVSVVGRLTTGAGTLISTFGSLVGAGGTVSTIMTALTGPVGLVVAAIGAAIAIGVLLYKNWDTICEWAGELKEKVLEKWTAIKDGITSKVDSIKNAATEKFEALKTGVGTIHDNMKNYIDGKLDAIKTAYETHGGGIKGVAAAAMEGVKQYYTTGYDAINKLTNGKLGEVVDKFRNKMNDAKNTVSNIITGIKNLFNFSVSLPHISLPHFSVSPPGWKIGDLLKGSIPRLSISWYRNAYDELYSYKAPGVIGLGDGPRSDSEIITGEKHMLEMIGGVVDAKNAAVIQKMDAFMDMVATYMLMLIEKDDTPDISGDQIAQALTPAVMRYMREAADRRR